MQQVQVGKSIKNDTWITQEEVPNPDVLPELPGYHVLVRPVSIKSQRVEFYCQILLKKIWHILLQ